MNVMPSQPVSWEAKCGQFHPSDGELHLWRADLSGLQSLSSRMIALLSEEEQGRANHFRFSKPREQFALGRGILRCLLSAYAGVAPDKLTLQTGSKGKPYLAGLTTDHLHFNVAHTDDLMLILVGYQGSVGIDVEPLRSVDGAGTIIGLLFEPDERRRIEALLAPARDEAILSAWTLKEALGKAAGGGLVGALHWAKLALDPLTGRPLHKQQCCDGDRCYAARVVDLGSGYVCAAAMEIDPARAEADWKLKTYAVSLPDLRCRLASTPTR